MTEMPFRSEKEYSNLNHAKIFGFEKGTNEAQLIIMSIT
jgi:hypothetical protein